MMNSALKQTQAQKMCCLQQKQERLPTTVDNDDDAQNLSSMVDECATDTMNPDANFSMLILLMQDLSSFIKLTPPSKNFGCALPHPPNFYSQTRVSSPLEDPRAYVHLSPCIVV